MPFFRDPNLDRDEEDQQGSGVQLSSGGMQAGPDGDPNKGSGASATKSGSRFTNLDSYLNNNDAKGFGQQFGQKIESGIDQAKANMDQAAGQVRGQIGAYSTPSESQITGTIEKANKGAITDDDAKAYQGWANQKYEGPQGLADNPAAQGLYWGQADKAKTEANLAGKESGRFALLDQYFGRPSYNQGQKSLDNLLIQNGGGFNNQAQLQDKAASLVGYGNTQVNQLRSEAQTKAGQVEQSRQSARSALGLQDNGTIKGGALGGFQDDLNARVKNYDQRAAEAYQNSLYDVRDDALEAGTVGGLGLQDGQGIYDLDLAKYISQGAPAERAKLAGEDDYKKYLALTKLAGMDPTLLSPDKMNLASTQANPSASFNRDKLAQDLAARKADYEYEYNSPVVIPELGPNPVSYAQLQADINKYTKGTGNPADAGPAYAPWVQKYQAAIKALNDKYKAGRKINAPGVAPSAATLPINLGGTVRPQAPEGPENGAIQPGGEPAAPTTPAPADPGYQYEGHEWDDPDLMSMFDFERRNPDGTPKLKVR